MNFLCLADEFITISPKFKHRGVAEQQTLILQVRKKNQNYSEAAKFCMICADEMNIKI